MSMQSLAMALINKGTGRYLNEATASYEYWVVRSDEDKECLGQCSVFLPTHAIAYWERHLWGLWLKREAETERVCEAMAE